MSEDTYKISGIKYNEDSILRAYNLSEKEINYIENSAIERKDYNMLQAISALKEIKLFSKSLKNKEFSDDEIHHIAMLCYEYI